MSTNTPIAVIGAGAWGTALAIAMARQGHTVFLWGNNSKAQKEMHAARCNVLSLPDALFPDTLHATDDLADALEEAERVLIATPSHAMEAVLNQLKPLLRENSSILSASKGFSETGDLLHTVSNTILGPNHPFAVLSGPSFAKEVANGLPTAITLAASDERTLSLWLSALHHDNLRLYTSNDLIGTQLGGCIKNVLAIAAGASDGLSFGANARAAIITRGLAEIMRLGQCLGAQTHTLMGLAGIGDLVLTCSDDQSRNRRFGLAIGQGKTTEDAVNTINQTIEGLINTRHAYALARRHHVETPLIDAVYGVLYEGKPLKETVSSLFERAIKKETPY